jgi:hypothetical protein
MEILQKLGKLTYFQIIVILSGYVHICIKYELFVHDRTALIVDKCALYNLQLIQLSTMLCALLTLVVDSLSFPTRRVVSDNFGQEISQILVEVSC